MKVDVKQLEVSKKNLEKAIGNMDELVKGCIDEIALRILRGAKRTTPVDTGFLKDDWTLGAIVKNGKTYEVQVSNPTEYAMYVEYGHRIVINKKTVGWKDGFFMLTIAEKEVQKRVDRIVKNRIEKYYKGLFK